MTSSKVSSAPRTLVALGKLCMLAPALADQWVGPPVGDRDWHRDSNIRLELPVCVGSSRDPWSSGELSEPGVAAVSTSFTASNRQTLANEKSRRPLAALPQRLDNGRGGLHQPVIEGQGWSRFTSLRY